MDKEAIYNIWAPKESIWSPWVKPVLFACMDAPVYLRPELLYSPFIQEMSWALPPGQGAALVVDLPREEGVLLGLELARVGYRPVPLYNAVPKPTTSLPYLLAEASTDPIEVVEVEPIMRTLQGAAELLSQFHLPPDAPPVFLLDANRRCGRTAPLRGNFDNRSISFTTDFPSAIFLQTHGISRAVVVQQFTSEPQPDLAHTLRRWQGGGVRIEMKVLENPGLPVSCVMSPPSRLGAIWYRIRETSGLKRHYLGGYGGIIGQSSGG